MTMTPAPRIGISGSPRVVDTVLGPTLLHTATRFYVDAVVRAGGIPLVLPALGAEVVDDMIGAVDGLVVTGGGDLDPRCYGAAAIDDIRGVDPVRDEFDLALVRRAVDVGLPMLAICRGMQVVNVALGGSLVQHVDGHGRGVTHDVSIAPGSALAATLGVTSCAVSSMHHQAVLDAAPGLTPVAWAPDGTVEAVEQRGDADGSLVAAVQWHPELRNPVEEGGHQHPGFRSEPEVMVDDALQQRLFNQLVESARRSPRSARSPA